MFPLTMLNGIFFFPQENRPQILVNNSLGTRARSRDESSCRIDPILNRLFPNSPRAIIAHRTSSFIISDCRMLAQRLQFRAGDTYVRGVTR